MKKISSIHIIASVYKRSSKLVYEETTETSYQLNALNKKIEFLK